ncbi:MAG: Ohr subfamily peroxiredoxin, partial [Actinomyces sp.]|nr:Ohr subfamily peroxiredoxin [Actinomyces sp.]
MDTPNEIVYTVTADSTGGRAGTSSVPALGISHVMR